MNVFFAVLAGIVLISTALATAGDYQSSISQEPQTISLNTDSIAYNGYLRVYIVEPVSRWNNYDNEPYHYGFLDFAFNDIISLDYQDTYQDTITWNPSQEGFSDIEEENIMVMAAVFNPKIDIAYSNPPFQGKFETHFVDAATGVLPGETNSNVVTENFTHTVFVEEGTATWCPYCPAMANTLNDIHETGEFPFYFVALIDDKSDQASQRIREELNIAGFPSSFFDGGDKSIIGGSTNTNLYISRIQQSGRREVHDLDFTLSCEWTQDDQINIELTITNNEQLFNVAPDAPTITGPSSGKATEEHTYEFTGTDPDEDEVFIIIDWGDGSEYSIEGPYESGRSIERTYIWQETGDYTIRAQTRDPYDETSDWTTLAVSMPRAKKSLLSDTTLEISAINGGIGSVTSDIKNTGEEIAESIQSTIHVSGGIFNTIDLTHTCIGCSACGTTLAPNMIKTENTMEAGLIFGFGPLGITIEAWADNADQVTESTTGFVIGPLVLV